MLPTTAQTLLLLEEFISPDEERTLMTNIIASIPQAGARRSLFMRNAIQRWGSRKPYYTDMVSDIIPEYFQFLLDRLVSQQRVPVRPDSITMNQYLKGQKIAAHIDDPKAGSVITVLSLQTPAIMKFQRAGEEFSVALPPRSLVQMRDDIRYNWTHEILPVEATRYSLVFRNGQEQVET
jgi:alkylated DNA repair dioxygenase AlkB